MAKTYIPKFVFLIATLLRYLARWDEKLQSNLPPTTILEYKAMRDAMNAFMDALNDEE